MSFPNAIQTAIGSPGNIRIGTITGVNPVEVTLERTVLDAAAVGFLDGYVPALGDVVAISGQSAQPSARSASWLVHGVITGTPGPLGYTTHSFEINSATNNPAFVNVPGAAGGFVKRRPETAVAYWLNTSCFSSAINTAVQWQIVFTGSDGGAVSQFVTHFILNQAGPHAFAGGAGVVELSPGVTNMFPAGSLSWQVQWRVAGGAGTLTIDFNDRINLVTMEIVNA